MHVFGQSVLNKSHICVNTATATVRVLNCNKTNGSSASFVFFISECVVNWFSVFCIS